MPTDHGCLPAILITLLPNFGFFLIVDFTVDNGKWYSNLDHPSWGVSTGEIYFPLLLTANFIQGYAAFLVWDNGERGWMTGPVALYGTSLFLLWIHFPIFLGMKSLGLGAIDITLSLCTTLGATWLFFKENTVAGCLMIPHVCLVIYDTLRDWWMYSHNKSRKKQD